MTRKHCIAMADEGRDCTLCPGGGAIDGGKERQARLEVRPTEPHEGGEDTPIGEWTHSAPQEILDRRHGDPSTPVARRLLEGRHRGRD